MKKLTIQIIFMLVFSFVTTVRAEEGLMVHYTFDEGSGFLSHDRSGNKNNGHIYGAQHVKLEGCYALKFDGFDDYIEVPDSPSLRFHTFTFELWVKPSAGTVPVIGKNYNDIVCSYLLQISSNGNKIYCCVLDEDGSTKHSVETNNLNILNKWTHVAITYDGRWIRVYVNGDQETFMTVGKLPQNQKKLIPYAGRPLNIGRSFHAPKWTYFKGEITEVRIYNRALSRVEIQERYLNDNQVLQSTNPSPTAHTESPVALPKRVKTTLPESHKKMIDLVKDGKPASTIVIPVDAKYWTTQAARWLKEYVSKVSGAELQIMTEDMTPSGTLISVGQTELARKAGINVADLKWDGCKLVVKDHRLYLIGKDLKKVFQNPKSRIADGNCRAVVTFLEDLCGVRWFLPGPSGEFMPKVRNIQVPSTLAKTVIPAIAFSGGRFPYGSTGHWLENITPAAIANNYRHGIAASSGGHTYYAMVPAEKYFKDHPEYFALIGGKRTGEGNHLCSTNPDVKRLLLRGMQEKFDQGMDVVTFGQEDGYMRCQCTECEKLDNYRFSTLGLPWLEFQSTVLRETPCERLFLLHKWVIDELRKSHPEGTVLLFAYAPTAWPSKKIDTWGNHVWVELANQEPEYIQAWKGKAAGITGYVYWFDIQGHMGMDVHATPGEVAEKIRYLHENGFLGFYHFPETNFGFQGPVIYALGKLMGNPYLDHRTLTEEYCRGVYGKAAQPMSEFFDLLYEGHEERIPLNLHSKKWPKWLATPDLYLMLYPPKTLLRLEKILTKAELGVDTEQSRGWVRHTRDYFDFTKLLTETVTAYRIYQKDKTVKNWLNLKKSVEEFDKHRMKIITYDKAYTDRWFPGHGHFCNYLTADAQHESKVYYIPWEKRKPEVLSKGIEGMAIGYGGGHGYSFIKEPLTLDFSKEKR